MANGEATKRAAIDLGTNTCLLLILAPDGAILHDESNTVRLGEDLSRTGVFSEAAMQRTLATLRNYAGTLDRHGIPCSDVVAVSTASGRNAKNAAQFFQKVKSEAGLSFRILSGDEEALATFLGADPGPNDCVIDIGGGSTEVVTGSHAISIAMGSVNLTERFLKSDPVTDQEFWQLEDKVDELLVDAMKRFDPLPKHGIAVAGTATTLASLQLALPKFDRTQIDAMHLSVGDLHRWVEDLKWRTNSEREKLPGMEASRAPVILAGAVILWRFLAVAKIPSIRVSTRGLRFGVLHKKFVTA